MADCLKIVHILVLARATIRYIRYLFDVTGDVGLDVLHNKINDLVNEVVVMLQVILIYTAVI